MKQTFFLLIFLLITTTNAFFKHVHTPTKSHHGLPALKIPTMEKKKVHKDSRVSKKMDLLGQDTNRLDEQEFKLQSMVSPEFHNKLLKNRIKQVGSLDLETMSPAEVSFLQSSTQWHKYSQPRPNGYSSQVNAAGTIFPEDPVPFPGEGRNRVQNSQGSESWPDLDDKEVLSGKNYKDFSMDSDYGNKDGWSKINKFWQQGENSFKNFAFPDYSPPARSDYVQGQLIPLKQKPIETIQDSVMFMGKIPGIKNRFSSLGLLGTHSSTLPTQGASILHGDLTGQKENGLIDSLMSANYISGSNGLSKVLGSSNKGSSFPVLSSSNFSKLKTQNPNDTGANTRSHSARQKSSNINRKELMKRMSKKLWVKKHRTQKLPNKTRQLS